MGLFGSKPEAKIAENKNIDTAGQVNNNVVISNEEPIDIKSIELILLVGIICAIQICKFVHCLYAMNQRKMKKRYRSSLNLSKV